MHVKYGSDACQPALQRKNPFWQAMPVACRPKEKTLSHAWWGAGIAAPRGNKNAQKHGHYTREAIARRRQLGELMRELRKLILKIE